MKVILIDDEKLALDYLEHKLLKMAGIDVVGKFTEAGTGKEAVLQEDVDVVFLDIHLPGMNGIELAEQILESKPGLHIVFVTAFDDYAIKAFELNALDYVMKPVDTERLRKTIKRIQERTGADSGGLQPKQQTLWIKMFQQVSFDLEDFDYIPIRWRTNRAQELFLYLLQHRGQLVRKSVLIDLLWPEYEPGKAYSQLYTAIYHIRKTLKPLGGHFKLSNAMDGYILMTYNVRLDVEEWENKINSGPPISDKTIRDYESIMSLYDGDYLQEFEYWWAESERHRLKLIWLRISFHMAECYLSCNRKDKAIEKYLEICNRHPQAEEAHFALMKIFADIKNHLAVHRQFRLLSTVLTEELNAQPSPYITEWYQKWELKNKQTTK